ncbi:hypothetical protein NQZ79_g8107 [Umbelopsis isabellina]|nr:hypothetical protein NQZ79_g8443 [Umbelopsis isabellina]KAJ2955999.1 hypothetical protein NQZ79_g8107 [Umbelopsis isabellina]
MHPSVHVLGYSSGIVVAAHIIGSQELALPVCHYAHPRTQSLRDVVAPRQDTGATSLRSVAAFAAYHSLRS